MKTILRAYRPADFETLYEIDQACYSREIAYSRRELHNYLRFPGAECVVVEVKDPKTAVAGFCIAALLKGWGYIVTIDVLPGYRRQGIATSLLREIEGRLKAHGAKEVALETATDNEPAIAFWKKHGYRTRGIKKGYYPGGIDAYSMVKPLT